MCGMDYKSHKNSRIRMGYNRDIFMPDFLLVGYRNGVLKHVNKI